VQPPSGAGSNPAVHLSISSSNFIRAVSFCRTRDSGPAPQSAVMGRRGAEQRSWHWVGGALAGRQMQDRRQMWSASHCPLGGHSWWRCGGEVHAPHRRRFHEKLRPCAFLNRRPGVSFRVGRAGSDAGFAADVRSQLLRWALVLVGGVSRGRSGRGRRNRG
jgi:hypothetical protein